MTCRKKDFNQTKSFVKATIASKLLLFNASINFLNAVNVQFADVTYQRHGYDKP
jgi:hypothetical protein